MQDFVENFASQFDNTDPSAFTPATKFKDLSEWSSMIALCVIAMVDENYDVKIKGDDIRSSATIEDLYKLVQARR